MKTYSPKPPDIERRWYVIDASGAVLGRLATEVASILRGKHKPIFAPHMDTGDHVIIVNARGVRLTGGKEEKKVAYRHSGYPGGLTETPYSRLLATKPHFAVEKAVRGMLPKNRLGRAMVKKLQVYPGPDHPHRAQQPTPLRLGEVPPWEGLPERVARSGGGSDTGPQPSKPKPAPQRTAAKPSTTPAAAKKSTAKKSTKTSTAKKSTAKKPTAKRATASTGAKRSGAKASSATSTAKRTTARRAKKED